MKTEIFREDLTQVARILREGGLVAVPTETVYGLAGSGLSHSAVEEIYRVKGRPEQKPLSLLVPGPEALDRYCHDVPPAARRLAERFWPGPLTLVLRARPEVPAIVRAGGETVGLRCPDHPMTLRLLRLTGLPLAAPSANPSGLPSPKTAGEVLAYFDGQIPAVLDGGPCGLGRESTILDMSQKPWRVLRQGALDREALGGALAEGLTVIGITGGSGCGKTTALEALEARGALVIDCDKVYHRLLETDEELLERIGAHFPGTVNEKGLDRRALGAVVFANREKLALLNRLTHERVGREVGRLLAAWALQGGSLAAVDAIELIGSGLAARCAAVVGILADRDVRVRRIMERDGITESYARLRIDAQRPDRYFEDNCDYIVRNDSEKELFIEKFNRVIKEVTSHGRAEEQAVF